MTDKFTLNYWLVNGTNQVEATNGFKDELFGFTAKPTKNITWTFNYYLGQEHPDREVVANPTNPVAVQPGLAFQAIRPAPDGRTHIFDSYLTWQATPKLTLAVEGDYLSVGCGATKHQADHPLLPMLPAALPTFVIN